MASCFRSTIILALTLAMCAPGILGKIECEDLDQDSCAFAVSATGKRCALEKQVRRSGEEAYTCLASEIDADDPNLRDYVEADHCISACGLDRKSLGISSDSLIDAGFTQKLCSAPCYNYCPNIVDLHFSLAAGEGVFLPKLCEAQKEGVHRGLMSEMKSSGMVAPEPVHPVKFTAAPAMAPHSTN